MHATARKIVLLSTLLGVAAALFAWPAAAAMETTKLERHLCKTVHGGKFVDIPGFPGEKIDRRLLTDIRWMKRRFDIFITDGYSTSSVHAPLGEHPIGLALDIIPNKAKGGNWNKIGELAHWAEPRRDQPRAPFRWVGWNGDTGHGRGDHLHLSFMHSPTEPRDPARVVYTRKCPEKRSDGDGARRHHRRSRHDRDGRNRNRDRTGGVSPKAATRAPSETGNLAPVVPETE